MPTESISEPVAAEVSSFRLEIPPPQMLTAKEELAIAQEAYLRHPDKQILKLRLAQALKRLDKFTEVIDLLTTDPTGDISELLTLTGSYLNLETLEGNVLAKEYAERALSASDTPLLKARALTELAKVYRRLHEDDRVEPLLREALELNPQEKDAYKRLFHHIFDKDAEAGLRVVEETMAKGVLHARVLGSWAIALTRAGRLEEAREALGFPHLTRIDPAPPEGFATLAEFNAALAHEALHHPDMRYDRYGVASAHTWRLDEPAMHRTPVFQKLQKFVKREVERFASNLTGNEPFHRARPRRAQLRNWCVITEGEGFEHWHVHQNGWLSGVYYIQVQDHIVEGTNNDGCIAFGMHDGFMTAAETEAFGKLVVRPAAGMMMLFPSHLFHRTYAHHGTGHRICFAFDVIPIDEH